MTRQFDDKTLSAFLDGELDDLGMQEVDNFIQENGEAQKFVLNTARSTAFLKAASNVILHEKVPDRLVNTVKFGNVPEKRESTTVRSLFQLAAAIVLVFFGFGAGNLFKSNQMSSLPASVAPILQQYGHIVDAALENNLSGDPREWNEPRQPLMIMVTPIQTFRDRNNIYYRKYRLEVVTETHRQQVNGLAYRSGGGKWITKALFFEDKTTNDS